MLLVYGSGSGMIGLALLLERRGAPGTVPLCVAMTIVWWLLLLAAIREERRG